MATWSMHRSSNKVSLSKPHEKSKKAKINRTWSKRKAEDQNSLHLRCLIIHHRWLDERRNRSSERPTAIFSVFTYLRWILDLRKRFWPDLELLHFIYFYMSHSQSFKQTSWFRRKVRTFSNSCVVSKAFFILETFLLMLWAQTIL